MYVSARTHSLLAHPPWICVMTRKGKATPAARPCLHRWLMTMLDKVLAQHPAGQYPDYAREEGALAPGSPAVCHSLRPPSATAVLLPGRPADTTVACFLAIATFTHHLHSPHNGSYPFSNNLNTVVWMLIIWISCNLQGKHSVHLFDDSSLKQSNINCVTD